MDEKDLFAPPSEQEISNEELFAEPSKDELSDDELFAAPSVEEIESPSEDISPTLGGPVGGAVLGGIAGQVGSHILDTAPDQLDKVAENLAFSGIGGKSTKAGKDLMSQEVRKMLDPDAPDLSLFGPREIGRKVLDENLFDVENVGKAGKQSYQDLENLLEQVKTKAPVSDIQEKLRSSVTETFPVDAVDQPSEAAQKKLEKRLKTLEGKPDQTAKMLEDSKRRTAQGLDYTKPHKTSQKLKKIEAGVFRGGVEDLVKQEGGDELLDAFKKAKTEGGKMSVIRSIVSDDLIKDLATEHKIGFEEALALVYNRPDIYFAKKALKSGALPRTGAKVFDKVSKGIKSITKSPITGAITKNLGPIGALVGGLLTTSDAMAEGASPTEAIKEAVQEEGLDSLLGPAYASSAGQPERGSLARKLQSGEELTEEEQKQLYGEEEYDRVQEIKTSTPTIKPVENERTRLEGFLNEYSQLSQQSPSINNYVNKVQSLMSEEDENKKAANQFSLEQQPAFKHLMSRVNKKDKMN